MYVCMYVCMQFLIAGIYKKTSYGFSIIRMYVHEYMKNNLTK